MLDSVNLHRAGSEQYQSSFSLDRVGNVGRSGIFVLQPKLYFVYLDISLLLVNNNELED